MNNMTQNGYGVILRLGEKNTHTPVLIQQCATKLAQLREKIGYVEQD